MQNKRETAAIETEVLSDFPGELHIFPRETRRGKAQWAIWVKPDGSGVLFSDGGHINLPKNSAKKSK